MDTVDRSYPQSRRGGRPELVALVSALTLLALTPAAALGQSDAQPITDATTELAAGTWSDASSGPTIEFTVEDGWYVDGRPIEGVGVALAHSAFDGAYAAITQFDGRVFPDACATADNAELFWEGPPVEIPATAASFSEHLEAHPLVSVSATTPVEISGYSGLQLDMRSSVAAECEPRWAWLWVLPEVGDFHLNDAEDARFIALDVGDHVTVIALEGFTGPDLEAPAVDWAGFLEVADGMLGSMKITPAE